MTKRPRFASAQKNAMLTSVYKVARLVYKGLICCCSELDQIELTTAIVPTTSCGGSRLMDTMEFMKLAVMPMTVIMATACMARIIKKVALRGAAP